MGITPSDIGFYNIKSFPLFSYRMCVFKRRRYIAERKGAVNKKIYEGHPVNGRPVEDFQKDRLAVATGRFTMAVLEDVDFPHQSC